uniref:Uncharacterized protein n=1 Tax=Borrelia garinii subsp. bavariensis (strain ATCC BAA-2496 / DSM 23469 / PBi) TaxID=290434 RepID=A0A7M4BL03_BORGP|nr:hypothetical protein BGP318 [Borreliella bavariensis PBi]
MEAIWAGQLGWKKNGGIKRFPGYLKSKKK